MHAIDVSRYLQRNQTFTSAFNFLSFNCKYEFLAVRLPCAGVITLNSESSFSATEKIAVLVLTQLSFP